MYDEGDGCSGRRGGCCEAMGGMEALADAVDAGVWGVMGVCGLLLWA